MTTLTKATSICAILDHVSSDLDGETIVLNLASGHYFGLEGVGGDVWELLQQPITLQEICTEILQRYDVEPSACENDVTALITELISEGLVKVIT
jgi:hypothetical protein